MATTIDSPSSAASLNKECPSLISSSFHLPKFFSPSSDKRLWSTLRIRFDSFLENQNPIDRMKAEAMEQTRRLKQESKLLLRGFDSMACSMSLFSTNLDTALPGTRDLTTRPPTFIEILEATIEENRFQPEEDDKRGLKRKLDNREMEEQEQEEAQNERYPDGSGKLKRAKNMAISTASKAVTMPRELKSIQSELEFLKERCASLEEENNKLRQRFAEDKIQPGDHEDDDLVRLQLEALLAEKSRLANENANLARENQILHQLVAYHQLTSDSYNVLTRGTGPVDPCRTVNAKDCMK